MAYIYGEAGIGTALLDIANGMSKSEPGRKAAPCPWCGPGTQLALKPNGAGFQALTCLKCGSAGPLIEISSDFAQADTETIRRWSTRAAIRPPLDPDILERIQFSIALQKTLSNDQLQENQSLSIRLRDLYQLLIAANVPIVTQNEPDKSM